MKTIFIVTAFLIIGCNQHPQVGDWYEHKGSRERIKIEYVGLGRLAYKYCRKQCDIQIELLEKARIKPKYDDPIRYYPWDSLNTCFVYQDRKYIVSPIKELEDYKLIE